MMAIAKKTISIQEANSSFTILKVTFEMAKVKKEMRFKVKQNFLCDLGFYNIGEASFTGLEFRTNERPLDSSLLDPVNALEGELLLKRTTKGEIRKAPVEMIGITGIGFLDSAPQNQRRELEIRTESSVFILKDEGSGVFSCGIF